LKKNKDGDIEYYDANINLISKMMSFENTLTSYLYQEFLFNCKNVSDNYFTFTVCNSQGFTVPGLPVIDVSLKNSRIF